MPSRRASFALLAESGAAPQYVLSHRASSYTDLEASAGDARSAATALAPRAGICTNCCPLPTQPELATPLDDYYAFLALAAGLHSACTRRSSPAKLTGSTRKRGRRSSRGFLAQRRRGAARRRDRPPQRDDDDGGRRRHRQPARRAAGEHATAALQLPATRGESRTPQRSARRRAPHLPGRSHDDYYFCTRSASQAIRRQRRTST